MSDNLQIIPAYFGPTRHKFNVIQHSDVSGKTTEYFILKQFVDYIGLRRQRNVLRKYPEVVRLGDIGGVAFFSHPLGAYNQSDTLLIPEAALYKFLIRCKHPKADPFVDWVCNEVLPAIRERGFYELPNIPPQQPQIEYVVRDKSHKERMEEFQTLTCGCV